MLVCSLCPIRDPRLGQSTSSHRAKRDVKHAPCAAGLLAVIDGFLLRLPLVCRRSPACEIAIRGERSALLVESGPQDARLAALGADGQRLFFGACLIVFALRPSCSHVPAAVCDGAPETRPGCWRARERRARARARGRADRRSRGAVLIAESDTFRDRSLLRVEFCAGCSPGDLVAIRRDGAAGVVKTSFDQALRAALFDTILESEMFRSGLVALVERNAPVLILPAVSDSAIT